MLTYHQAETVAYLATDSCEWTCVDCVDNELRAAASWVTDVGIEKWHAGLDTPVQRIAEELGFDGNGYCRYTLDEYDGERTYDAAEERVRDWEYDHPKLAELFGIRALGDPRWRLIDRIAAKLGDTYHERCGSCDKVLA